MEIDSGDVGWIHIRVTQDHVMLMFNLFLNLNTEVQKPITIWGCGQPSTEALNCCSVVVRGVSVLSSSVQCGAVQCYDVLFLAKEREWFEKRGRGIICSVWQRHRQTQTTSTRMELTSFEARLATLGSSWPDCNAPASHTPRCCIVFFFWLVCIPSSPEKEDAVVILNLKISKRVDQLQLGRQVSTEGRNERMDTIDRGEVVTNYMYFHRSVYTTTFIIKQNRPTVSIFVLFCVSCYSASCFDPFLLGLPQANEIPASVTLSIWIHIVYIISDKRHKSVNFSRWQWMQKWGQGSDSYLLVTNQCCHHSLHKFLRAQFSRLLH
jgi:hypothetical protein